MISWNCEGGLRCVSAWKQNHENHLNKSKSCQNCQIISSHPSHFAENPPSKLRHFMTSCHVWTKWVVFFLVVPCPIHWLNAYANASARLRGLERVPTPEVFYTRCLRGCLRAVPCWMAMLVVNIYISPNSLLLGFLMQPFVGGSWADGLDARARPPRKPTRAYAVEPRQIPRNHLSYSYKFLCITSCAYSGNYDYICRNKLVDNVHIPSHLKNANEHLPTRLVYAKKI